MKLLSVGITGTYHDVADGFQCGCRELLMEGYRIAVDETNKGNYTFIGYNIVEGELSFRSYERIKGLLKKHVVSIVADRIIYGEEKKIICQLVERNYPYFSEEERDIVLQTTLELLGKSHIYGSEAGLNDRKTLIINRLADYFETHHELIVEGFVRFRLKDYRAALEHIVDQAVDGFIMDMEHKEFIRVLRQFANSHDKKMEESHVIVQSSNSFKIVDAAGQTVTNPYLDNFAASYIDEINYEDLLITTLITLVPRRITIHNPLGKDADMMIHTVQGVFEAAVGLCRGCDLCRLATACIVDNK